MKKSKAVKKPLPKKPKPKVVKRPPPKKSTPTDEALSLVKKALEKMNASKQKALLALAAAATAVAAAATALAEPDEGSAASPEVKPVAPAAKPKPVKVEPCDKTVTGPDTTHPRRCTAPMPHGAGEHQFPPDVPEVAPAAAKAVGTKPAKAAAATVATQATGDAPMFDQVVTAFKDFCSVYGREEGVKLMKKFLPEGGKALADIPEDKLPELLAALKA